LERRETVPFVRERIAAKDSGARSRDLINFSPQMASIDSTWISWNRIVDPSAVFSKDSRDSRIPPFPYVRPSHRLAKHFGTDDEERHAISHAEKLIFGITPVQVPANAETGQVGTIPCAQNALKHASFTIEFPEHLPLASLQLLLQETRSRCFGIALMSIRIGGRSSSVRIVLLPSIASRISRVAAMSPSRAA
jgi:hypothetical protein